MAKKTGNKRKVGVRQVLTGSIFMNKDVLRWLPYVGLFAFFGLLLISNRFKGEKIIRATVVLQGELKELRSESATVEAELMNVSKYSGVLSSVERMGLDLEQPNQPPVRIIVKK